MENLTKIIGQLKETNDGGVFFNLLHKELPKHQGQNINKVKEFLRYYIKNGKIDHARDACLIYLTEISNTKDSELYGLLFESLDDPTLTYAAIDCLEKLNDKKACQPLITIVKDANANDEIRANAIKALSKISKQAFDQGMPTDPGDWTSEEVENRAKEVVTWEKDGLKTGLGYQKVKPHPNLKNPVTEIDKLAKLIEEKLSKERKKDTEEQDLVHPQNYLIPAQKDDLNKIKEKWNLLPEYLEFITKYSPLHVLIYNEKFYDGLHLYGADELISLQEGYSITESGDVIKAWPKDYIVIADHAGDPFCLNLNIESSSEIPVLTAEHGNSTWDFTEYSKSFIQFLKDVFKISE